jgi:hypothetical protein
MIIGSRTYTSIAFGPGGTTLGKWAEVPSRPNNINAISQATQYLNILLQATSVQRLSSNAVSGQVVYLQPPGKPNALAAPESEEQVRFMAHVVMGRVVSERVIFMTARARVTTTVQYGGFGTSEVVVPPSNDIVHIIAPHYGKQK